MNQSRLKVLFVSQLYGQQIHGPSRKLVLLNEIFAKENSNVELRVLTEDAHLIASKDYLLKVQKPARLLHFLEKYYRSKAYSKQVEEIYSEWKFDFVVFNDAPKAYSTLSLKSTRYKVVAMLNDTNSVEQERRPYETFRKHLSRRLLARMELYVVHKADLVICPSLYLAERVKEQYRATNLPKVMHPAIDLSEWGATRLKNYSIKKTLLFVKSDPFRGGLHILLKALEDSSMANDYCKLIIGGLDRAEEVRFKQKAKKVKVDIEWRGIMKRNEFRKAISESHVGVVPSLYEAFSITTSEYAAGGLQVVASDAEGIPEGASGFGLFFKSGDVASLQSALLKAAMLKSSEASIQYDHNEMANKFQQLLSD